MSTSADQPRYESTGAHGDHDGDHDGVRRTPDRKAVLAREKEEHGGIKWGSAFFGWLTAAGTAILVTALLSAIGTAVGLGVLSGPQQYQETTEYDAFGRVVEITDSFGKHIRYSYDEENRTLTGLVNGSTIIPYEVTIRFFPAVSGSTPSVCGTSPPFWIAS